jgi:hypothetical protein
VPAADDVVEQVGGAAVAREIAKLVGDQEFRSDISVAQAASEGAKRFATEEVGQQGGEAGESD